MVKFFLSQRQTLKWRGIIYQHVAIDTQGPAFQTVTVAGWTQSDHMNHIHIDWFRSSMVTWIHLTEIPVVVGGVTTIIAPKERNRIASVIEWPPEAQTDFSGETGVQSGLAALMAQRDAGALTAVDMTAEASQYVAASTR